MPFKDDDGTPSGSGPPNYYGLWGDSKAHDGVAGTSGTGTGVQGSSGGTGVYGNSFGIHFGTAGPPPPDADAGVRGSGEYVFGVYGYSRIWEGVVGKSSLGTGVVGWGGINGIGVEGIGNVFGGVGGYSNEGPGVEGHSTNHAGVYATNRQHSEEEYLNNDVYLALPDQAGAFIGNVYVRGYLKKSGGGFEIDHVLDPAHKLLNHAFVESPDMKNIYDGVARLNDQGEAVVELPAWFEALNQDFRYQLTPLGAPAPNLFIAEEIAQNRFKIAGGQSGMRVSWQVTGSRRDAWALANPVRVEQDKPAAERGHYLHPHLFNQPAEKSIMRVRYPRPPVSGPEMREQRAKEIQQNAEEIRQRAKEMREKLHDLKPPQGRPKA